MENIASKGRGRPRKAVSVPLDAQQGEGALDAKPGDGQARAIGSGTPTKPVKSWHELVQIVSTYTSWKRAVSHVFWHEVHQQLIPTPLGFARVHFGEPMLVLNNGELVKI